MAGEVPAVMSSGGDGMLRVSYEKAGDALGFPLLGGDMSLLEATSAGTSDSSSSAGIFVVARCRT